MTSNVICTVTANGNWVATCANQAIADLLISVLTEIADSDDEPATIDIEEQVPDQLDPARAGV